MSYQRGKITKRSVDALTIADVGETRLWDTEVKGFLVRVRRSGRKTYAVKYRVGRRQRLYTIGTHGSPWTPETARQAALDALDQIRRGGDPSGAKADARNEITVAQLIDLYLAEGPATKPSKRASTWEIDASNLNRHIRVLLGGDIANGVTKAEAAKAIKDITDGKTAKSVKTRARGKARITGGAGTARRTRITAAAMFAWGIEHGHVRNNPFKGVKLGAAPKRETFLTVEQAKKLLAAIDSHLAQPYADAAKLLLLTGARKTEILGLQWSEVDFDRNQLRLPPERTKAGGTTGERRVILAAPALDILRRRATARSLLPEAKRSKFVFPSSRGDTHVTGLRRPFQRACEAAGLPVIRVHDLRHSFASLAVANGASLFVIGKLLGHASTKTTERYAHLTSDPLQEAAGLIAASLIHRSRDHV